MASYTSGANQQTDGLRRRVVPEYESNGQVKYSATEQEVKRKTPRKVFPLMTLVPGGIAFNDYWNMS